jgi:hypothetical protein
MKFSRLLWALPVVGLLLIPAFADDAKTASLSWLHERGLMTTGEVVEAVGVKVSDAQRAEIDSAVRERNAELEKINARFSAAVSKTLGSNDEELARKVAEEKERRRKALIKSRQPGRYNGMKK